MVVTSDIGNLKDIHPKNKQEVGRRLSLWALANTYNKKAIVPSGPIYKSMYIEGSKIIVSFDYNKHGLEIKGEKLLEFSIAGEDRIFYNAKAK